MSDLQKRIIDLAKGPRLLNLATVTEDGKPWVRYVTGKIDEGLSIRFSTRLDSDKVRHMRGNPNVHVTLGEKDVMKAKRWVQIEGTAEISTAQAERDAFWHDGLKAIFKGPDDPNYGVVSIKPFRIELGSLGSLTPEVWQPEE